MSATDAAGSGRPDAAASQAAAVSTAGLLASAGVDPGWASALAPVAADLDALEQFLAEELAAGRDFLPAAGNVLRAFHYPPGDVRVLIVGQDPYPTPGHSIGLAFAVEPHVRPVPRSLANIYRELRDDLGIEPPAHGDLTPWAEHGVMLLNRVLTVQPGVTGSHRRRGWERVTEHVIRTLVARPEPLVAILWGRDAANLRPLLGDTPVIESAHPSPLSARRGFFGSRPFSRANALLETLGAPPVDWTLRSSPAGKLEATKGTPVRDVKDRPATEPETGYTMRDAVEADLPAIRDIYDYYVANTTVTFDEDGMSLDGWRDKLANLNALGMPFIVVESDAGVVLGYALVMPWKPKKAYRYTVENSIYLGPAGTGRGIGPVLLAELLERAAAAGLKEVIAVIADEAEVSIRLHERFGFEEIGRMRNVGFKFERWLGIRLLQKSL